MNRKVTMGLVGVLLLLALLVGTFGACAKPSAPAKPKVDVVKIGDVSAYSGAIASICARIKEGQDMALEELNAAGGIKSLGGAKIDLLHYDHEYKAELAKEYFDRVINRDKVHVTIHGAVSGYGVMLGKMCEEAGVAMYTILVNTPAKTQQGFKTVFSTPKDSRMIAQTTIEMMSFLADKYMKAKPKRVALWHPDNEYNNQVAEGAKVSAAQLGYEIVGEVVVPFPPKDLTSFVLKLKELNPDWVFVNPVGEAIGFERQLDVLGWDPLRIGIEGSYVETALMEGLGTRAENLISCGNYNDDATPDAKTFTERFRKRWGHDPDSMSAQGYQILYVIAAAIEKAGKEGNWDSLQAARESIIKASHELVYTEKTGPLIQPYKKIQYDQTGQVPTELCPTVGTQVQGGKFKTVYPEVKGTTLKFNDAWKKWMK